MSETRITESLFRPTLRWLPFAVLVVVYLPTLYDLGIDWWTDPNYSHGFLVPLISGYLIWSRRSELVLLEKRSNLAGLVVVMLGLVMFVLGTAAAEYFTARLSFVISLFGLIWYLYGNQYIKKVWFALFFLCFMIPIPYVIYYAIAFPLQIVATKITVGILDIVGMGVIRQGNIIHLAGGHSLEVAEACSGMRSLVALLALGALYAYWSQRHFAAKAILFLSTIPVAVFANVVRVLVTTTLVATVTTRVTDEPIHTIMGLLVFIIAYLGLMMVGMVLKRIFRYYFK